MQRGKIPVQKSIAQKSYSGPYTFALSDVFESYEIRRYKPLILRAVNKLSVLIQAKTFLITPGSLNKACPWFKKL